MPFAKKVKSMLWAIVDAMAQNKALFVKNPEKDFSRERELGFVQMIRFCLCMESGCINHELLKYFYFNPDDKAAASAFIQQRANNADIGIMFLMPTFFNTDILVQTVVFYAYFTKKSALKNCWDKGNRNIFP